MKSFSSLLKNKITWVLVVIVMILLGVAFFILKPGSNPSASDETVDEMSEVKQVSPDELGLVLTSKQNGQVINMKIANIKGITSIEYDLTYDSEVEGLDEPTGRGVTGVFEIKGEPIDEDIDLGTCSKKVCKYDKVVSDVTVILRINYENGEVGGSEAKISVQ